VVVLRIADMVSRRGTVRITLGDMTRDDYGIEGPLADRIGDAVANQAAIFKDTFPGALGVVITDAGPGFARGTLPVGTAVRHPGGYAHGGAIAGFGDTVAAWATFPALGADEIFTTIEFKTNFITGVTDGELVAEARAIHKGNRTMVLEVRISAEDKLVAVMLVTQAILKAKSDAGDEGEPHRR
jgi:1,4-dihydroxy-2-naphthoyl-CoA hydrolase